MSRWPGFKFWTPGQGPLPVTVHAGVTGHRAAAAGAAGPGRRARPASLGPGITGTVTSTRLSATTVARYDESSL